MKAQPRYTARFERSDDDELWVVSIEGVPGCHTQAKSIEQGLERIREALELFIGDEAETVAIEASVTTQD